MLRAGGWFPGRSIPTAPWATVLLETGEYEVHEAARPFLAEFGYVGFPHPAPGQTPPGPELLLDPLAARWDAEIIDALAEQAGAGMDSVRLSWAAPRRRRSPHSRRTLNRGHDGASACGLAFPHGDGWTDRYDSAGRLTGESGGTADAGGPQGEVRGHGLTCVTLGVFSPARLASPPPPVADCPSCSAEC